MRLLRLGRAPSWWTIFSVLGMSYFMLWPARTLASKASKFADVGAFDAALTINSLAEVAYQIIMGLLIFGFTMVVYALVQIARELKNPLPIDPLVNLEAAMRAVSTLRAQARDSTELLIDRKNELAHIQELISLSQPQIAALERKFKPKRDTVLTIVSVLLAAAGIVLTLVLAAMTL